MAAGLYLLVWMLGYFAAVVIPLAIALLLAALLAPAVSQLTRLRVPRGLATGIVLVGGLALLGGVLTFVVSEFTQGLPELQRQVTVSLVQIRDWLVEGPLGLGQEQIQDAIDSALLTLQESQSAIATGALSTAAGIGEGITGFLLALFILIFFLASGDKVWAFLVRGFPGKVRNKVDKAGQRGFQSLVDYVRATALVAVVDAIGIGVGLAIVGVPLVIPLATLTFLAAFIPIVGAIVAGAVAVLIALVSQGFVAALIVLGIVLAVQQLEGNVLQPLLLGRAVKLHPLAVVLAISAGLVAAGIVGALLSVPLLAVISAGVRSLLEDNRKEAAAKAELESDTEPDTGSDSDTEPDTTPDTDEKAPDPEAR